MVCRNIYTYREDIVNRNVDDDNQGRKRENGRGSGKGGRRGGAKRRRC